jgi:hypothetical protein
LHAGEWRLASTIAARLASLGALTNADRRAAAASKSLSKYVNEIGTREKKDQIKFMNYHISTPK